jgi:predicted DCC family thiol-disulfide oxidoreductase YuxK
MIFEVECKMLTAIYDGNCIICNKTKAFITQLDHHQQVRFVDLHQIDYPSEEFPNITYEDVMGMIHVVDEQQNVYAGFDAIRHLLRLFPLTMPIYALSCMPFIGRRLGMIIYRVIADNRYRLNQLFGVALQSDNGNCDTDQCRVS